MLRVHDLTVHYRDEAGQPVVAADQVRFELAEGEVVGLLGESGAGKTTLALSLLGLLPPSARTVAGSVRFQDEELLGLNERRWRHVRGARIAAIFPEPGLALNPVLRVGRQIEEVIRAHRPVSPSQRRAAAEEALDEVGLGQTPGIYGAYPHELSGGQRQRVLIAQAVACRPALVVADEPTSALDAVTRAEILTLFKGLKQRLGLAVLLVSHDLSSLAALADRVLVMYAGRIVEQGPLRQLWSDPLHPYTRGLLASVPDAAGSTTIDGELPFIPGGPPDLARLPAGCAFEPRCARRMDACEARAPGEAEPEPGRRVRCLRHAG